MIFALAVKILKLSVEYTIILSNAYNIFQRKAEHITIMPKSTFFNLPDSKKNHLMDVAIDEFSKDLYQNISINRLIKSMGIATGSFYQYFEDKKDLYFYVVSYYMDHILDESIKYNIKIDLLNYLSNTDISKKFIDTINNTKNYQAVFVENFEKAPLEIQREWVFENVIGGKYMPIYDYSIFEEDIDPEIKKHKFLMMGIVISVSSVLQRFCNSRTNPEEHMKLYGLCIDMLKAGFRNYSSVNNSSSIPSKSTECR